MQFRVIRLPRDPDCRSAALIQPSASCARRRRSIAARLRPPETSIITPPRRHRNQTEGPDGSGDAPMIVDVREPAEFEICRIPGAVLIPLSQLPVASASSTGRRSCCSARWRPRCKATAYLRRAGFAAPQPDRRDPGLD
jgi:hypothetical protein